MWSRVAARLLILVGIIHVSLTSRAANQPPDRMSYQGFLVDNNGAALGDTAPTNYPVIFRIWSEAEGGDRLWSEQQIVTVDKGNFSVVLGDGNPADGEPNTRTLPEVFAGTTADQRHIEVTVKLGATPVTLSPRLRLLSTPYAFLATQASQLVGSSGAPFISLNAGQVIITNDTRFGGQISLGDSIAPTKIALFENSNETYGLGIAADGQFQLHLGAPSERFTFLDRPAGNRIMTLHGVGNVEIPRGNLAVSGSVQANSLSAASSISGAALSASGTVTAGSANILGALTANSITAGTGITANGLVSLGDFLANTKLALYRSLSGATLGLGVQSGEFRLHLDAPQSRFTFNATPGGTELMTVRGNGRVGIGTANPQAPLEVSGAVHTFGSFLRVSYDGNANLNRAFTGEEDFSIIASASIKAGNFFVFSDQRIKRDVSSSDPAKDLEAISQLRIRDYRLIDPVHGGTQWRKGVIAQEAREVIPQAVAAGSQFIPDLYLPCTNFTHHAESQRLTVRLGKAHHATPGQRVRIHSEKNQLELVVAQTPSDDTLVLDGCQEAPRDLFVYGREIPDFLSVDYDRIFTTGISAIQELHRRVQVQDRRIATLEERVSTVEALEAKVAQLQQRLAARDDAAAAWESRFKALEKLITASKPLRAAPDFDPTATPAPEFAVRQAP